MYQYEEEWSELKKLLNGLKRINVTLAVYRAGLVYVVIVMMNRMHIVSFAKLLMSGLRYMKKMVGRFLLRLPLEVIQENLCFVLILIYINNWRFMQHGMVLAWINIAHSIWNKYTNSVILIITEHQNKLQWCIFHKFSNHPVWILRKYKIWQLLLVKHWNLLEWVNRLGLW